MSLGIAKVLSVDNDVLDCFSISRRSTWTSAGSAAPLLIDSTDPEAVHIAVKNFANDVYRVTGARPKVHVDNLPGDEETAIVAATSASRLMREIRSVISSDRKSVYSELDGKWESFRIQVENKPLPGLEEGLIISGSDRVTTAVIRLKVRRDGWLTVSIAGRDLRLVYSV